MKTKNVATFFAVLAAALYAINIPLSKILLNHVSATMMAAFLYIGAGIGMFISTLLSSAFGKVHHKEPLTKKELPYTIAMVVLDIAAPIFLMFGIAKTTSANVSLLNNFEIVATSLIAFIIFKEVISKRLFIAIILVTIASIILSFEGKGAFTFNTGSLLVIMACICWGFENNCTKMLSNKSSQEIVIIKGCFSGLGSLTIALITGEAIPDIIWIISVLILGFISYGLSINFYIMAQKDLGAAKTSAYYSISPFWAVIFSIIIVGERPAFQFYIALTIMIISTIMMVKDTISLQHNHQHQHSHSHEHSHGNVTHTHEHTHVHSHIHIHKNNSDDHSHTHSNLNDHNHVHLA